MLTKDKLLEAGKRRVVQKEVANIGKVCLRSLSESEWTQFQQDSVDLDTGKVTREGLQTAKARLIALVLCDESGNRMFANADVPRIAEMDAAVVARLYEACEEVAGVTEVEAKN